LFGAGMYDPGMLQNPGRQSLLIRTPPHEAERFEHVLAENYEGST